MRGMIERRRYVIHKLVYTQKLFEMDIRRAKTGPQAVTWKFALFAVCYRLGNDESRVTV